MIGRVAILAVAALAMIAGAAHSADAYKNFKYKLIFEGRVVAGFSGATGLKVTVGRRPSHAVVSLERGLTHDIEFEKWAVSVLSPANGISLTSPKKDLVVQAMNEAGKVGATYTIRQSWASAYEAVPDLDANANAVAITVLKLENSGIESKP